jgi:hypothetical protein
MCAGVVRVQEVVAAGVADGVEEPERFDAPAAFPRLGKERPALARQQRRLDSSRRQPLDQPQRLPLAAAHFPSRVQVQDAHQLMILALEYLRNV